MNEERFKEQINKELDGINPPTTALSGIIRKMDAQKEHRVVDAPKRRLSLAIRKRIVAAVAAVVVIALVPSIVLGTRGNESVYRAGSPAPDSSTSVTMEPPSTTMEPPSSIGAYGIETVKEAYSREECLGIVGETVKLPVDQIVDGEVTLYKVYFVGGEPKEIDIYYGDKIKLFIYLNTEFFSSDEVNYDNGYKYPSIAEEADDGNSLYFSVDGNLYKAFYNKGYEKEVKQLIQSI